MSTGDFSRTKGYYCGLWGTGTTTHCWVHGVGVETLVTQGPQISGSVLSSIRLPDFEAS